MKLKTKNYLKSKLHFPILVFLLLFSFSGYTQEEQTTDDSNSNWDLGASVQSRYIWRGLNLGGNSASIQPSISYSNGIFSIGAWGAYSIGSDQIGQEADLYVTVSPLDFLSFTITDYFFPVERIANNNYFDYSDQTGHVFELMASFSNDDFPISLFVATNFAGADKNENGDPSYSTYIEASYNTNVKGVDLNVFAGAVVGDNGGYYGTNGSGLINLGLAVSKEIKITNHWNLPINAALQFNPDSENIYITFGFTI